MKAKAKVQEAEQSTRCVIADPLLLIEDDHALQLQVCDILEHLADGLPDRAEAHLAKVAAYAVRSGWPKHVQFEEEVLFPLLGGHAEREPHIEATILQLSREHASDLGSDDELVEALRELALDRRPSNPEMVGYMLRSYFQTLRRHVQWENAFLIPLARKVLTGEDQERMRTWLVEQGRAACVLGAVVKSADGYLCTCCADRRRSIGA